MRGRRTMAPTRGAICGGEPAVDAVQPVKSQEQQAVLMLHRARALLVGQRTALICAIRGHMAELGVVAPAGPRNIAPLLERLADENDERIAAVARLALSPLADQMARLHREIERLDRAILEQCRRNELSRRLAAIPGIGPLTASALAASVTDPKMFKSGSCALLGLVPDNLPPAASSWGGFQDGRSLSAISWWWAPLPCCATRPGSASPGFRRPGASRGC